MEFHLGDKVLVRRSCIDGHPWTPAFFAYEIKNSNAPFVIFGGMQYDRCIPLQGNEGLVGKTEAPEKKEQKPRQD